jgi:hypothetical protein
MATNSKQARVIFRYVRALLTNIPMLAKIIERETADAFDLSNSVTIEVHPASAKSTRGYTVVAALLDEVAFFPTDDSANMTSWTRSALEWRPSPTRCCCVLPRHM